MILRFWCFVWIYITYIFPFYSVYFFVSLFLLSSYLLVLVLISFFSYTFLILTNGYICTQNTFPLVLHYTGSRYFFPFAERHRRHWQTTMLRSQGAHLNIVLTPVPPSSLAILICLQQHHRHPPSLNPTLDCSLYLSPSLSLRTVWWFTQILKTLTSYSPNIQPQFTAHIKFLSLKIKFIYPHCAIASTIICVCFWIISFSLKKKKRKKIEWNHRNTTTKNTDEEKKSEEERFNAHRHT